MKRILINATHNEEIRVALCKDNHLYDFDLENRTREQKKSNIYKGHVTRVEPSLEAVFVEYGSQRQGFLPIREIASEYLKGNPREDNIRKLIKEGDELIVQIEKEERGNKGAALSTYVSLAGRYLVLMPNNPRGGGISRQITGKLREEMKRMLANMELPKGMSIIVRTAGIGKTQEDLQHDLNHLLNIWSAIQEQNKKYPSPRLVHQEAGVVTRAVRDYLRDDISEIWIDNENAYNEAESFVRAVMPKQIDKLRKYTDYEPMFASFNVEKQIETAYQREVRLPSGGSIVIDQTEALVSIDINSAKSTKGSDVSETAYHTNLEAAEEIARQLRLRDMGGLIVIDFIDMNDSKHQKEVEKRLIDSTKYDRARVQFGGISKFGLMEMSRQRLRPSLEESTGYICPRCHGNGMIRDLRSLSLSIMRQIEEIALKQRHGEVQAEVPTDIAAFLLNEKRESLVYLEQDSGTRITILPHAHLESPNFNLNFNHDGFVPASYDRISDALQQESSERGYDVNWQTNDAERPEQQPTRQPQQTQSKNAKASTPNATPSDNQQVQAQAAQSAAASAPDNQAKPAAVAWLSNLFAPTPEARTADSISSQEAATAIETIVNSGAQSLGIYGGISSNTVAPDDNDQDGDKEDKNSADNPSKRRSKDLDDADKKGSDDRRKRKGRSQRSNRSRSQDKNSSDKNKSRSSATDNRKSDNRDQSENKNGDKRSKNTVSNANDASSNKSQEQSSERNLPKRPQHSKRDSRGSVERGEALTVSESKDKSAQNKADYDPNEVTLHINEAPVAAKEREVVHISLDEESNEDKSSKQTSVNAKQNDNSQTAGTEKSAQDQDTASNSLKDQADSELNTTTDATKTSSTSTQESAAPSSAEHGDDTSDASDTSESKVKPMRFDSDDLFASRYVTANKYGLAPNDPRVVMAAQANSAVKAVPVKDKKASVVSSSDTSHTSTDASSTLPQQRITLSGTVGEFIHRTLDDAVQKIEENGVIASFLHALAQLGASHNTHERSQDSSAQSDQAHADEAQKEAVQSSTHEISNVDFSNLSLSDLSFSNYGYQPLASSYLDSFHAQTSSVAKTSIAQGKTQAEPVAVTKRASNDPRGQHPDYQEETNVDKPVDDIADDNDTAANISAPETVVLDSMTDEDLTQTKDSSEITSNSLDAFSRLMSGSVGGFIEKILGDEGLQMIEQGKTESAFLQALKQPMSDIMERLQDTADVLSSELKSIESSLKHAEEETAHALASQDDVSKVEELAEALHQVAVEALSEHNEDDSNSQADSNKTSIESYKSMIENISEQLSPQQGLFNNLTTPKAPAKRGRKVKSEKPDNEDSDDSNS